MKAADMVLFAAGVIMTAGVLVIGFRYYQQGRKYADTVETETSAVLQEREEYFLTRYEGLTPSGASIIKYIKTNITRVETIQVTTNKKTFVADEAQFSLYQKASSEYYIDPLKTYTITINRNRNDVITSVTIKVN